MQLTTFTDYSLRVLIYAALRGDGPATINDVSNAYQISRNHVTKVVFRLSQLGYLETTRGKGGGMRLARRPELIVIGRVVRQTEEDFGLVGCLPNRGEFCMVEPACILKSAVMEALDAFFAVLDRYTLADLIDPRQKVSELLGIQMEKRKRGPEASIPS